MELRQVNALVRILPDRHILLHFRWRAHPHQGDINQRVAQDKLEQGRCVIEGIGWVDLLNPLLQDTGGKGAHGDNAHTLPIRFQNAAKGAGRFVSVLMEQVIADLHDIKPTTGNKLGNGSVVIFTGKTEKTDQPFGA